MIALTNRRKLAPWAPILLLIALTFNALLLKKSSDFGMATGKILIFRGGICALLVLISCVWFRSWPIIIDPQIQFLRLLVAGFSLSCATASYAFVSPATVTLMTRLDLPLLALLASRNTSSFWSRQTLLAVVAIAWFVGSILYMRDPGESIIGYILAASSGLSIGFGFWLVHRSSNNESWTVTVITPALASILFGIVLSALDFQPKSTLALDHKLLSYLMASCAGIAMFAIYILMVYRHRAKHAVLAELPGAIVPIALVIVDFMAFDRQPTIPYLVSILVGVSLVSTLAVWIGKPHNIIDECKKAQAERSDIGN